MAVDTIIPPETFSTVLAKCGYVDLPNLFNKFICTFEEVEIEMISNNERPVNVYTLHNNSYDEQIKYISEKGLVFYPMFRSEENLGFNHEYKIVNDLGLNTMSVGVLAKDLEIAKEFADCYKKRDHLKVGQMLDYPECCCQAFIDYTRYSSDPIFEIAQNTPHEESDNINKIVLNDIYYELQQHLRYFGPRMIPWLPCSFVCDESREKAKKWVDALKQKSPGLFDEIESIMKTSSTWDLYNAQVVVNMPPHKDSKFFGYATSVYFPQRKIVEFNPYDST